MLIFRGVTVAGYYPGFEIAFFVGDFFWGGLGTRVAGG